LYECECSNYLYDNLPDLNIQVITGPGTNEILTFPKEAYMKKKLFGVNNLMLMPMGTFKPMGALDEDEYWIIGVKFLQQYYTVFDYERKAIGFIKSDQSSADANGENFVLLMLFIILAFIILSCGCCFCCFCCKPCREWRNPQLDMAEYVEDESKYS